MRVWAQACSPDGSDRERHVDLRELAMYSKVSLPDQCSRSGVVNPGRAGWGRGELSLNLKLTRFEHLLGL